MSYDPQPTASHFIDGADVEDTNGTPIPVIYPATGEKIATVYAATPQIVEKAITAARDAQAAWAAMTGTERGRILRRAADIMRERNHDMSSLRRMTRANPIRKPRLRMRPAVRMRWNISAVWRPR